MTSKNTLVACMTASLFCTWGTAVADTFSNVINVNAGYSISDPALLYNVYYSNSSPAYTLTALDYVNGPLSGTQTFSSNDQGGNDVYGAAYSLIGIYTGPGNSTGAVVAMSASAASAAVGQSFESVFSVYNSDTYGGDESTFENAVTGGNYTSLSAFYSDEASMFSPLKGPEVLVAFSNGTVIGSLNPTPEPASLIALGLGAFALYTKRRRKA